MSLPAESWIERRQLRRKLTFWRVAAALVAAIALGTFFFVSGAARTGRTVEHIAKVRIEGTITEDEDLIQRLEDVRKSAAVKGVILSIDSPGGTTVGGEAIFEEVRKLAAEKPVVAQVGTLAASAGYLIASAADHIVARQTSIVGSIGVLIQYPDVTGLMDKLGIKMEEIKSSPLKAEPSPFNPTTDEERAAIRSMIMDSYDWFVGLVDERRPLNRQEATQIADGKVYTGRQALNLKLIDELGGEDQAVGWLKTKGVKDGLEVVEWKPAPAGLGGYFMGASAGDPASGIEAQVKSFLQSLGAKRLFLDGLVSLWQPE